MGSLEVNIGGATSVSVSTVTVPQEVVVHPLVLLSVVDHFNRVAKNTKKRVVGVLLGQSNGKKVNVANSFAVPFEEDEKDPSVWFMDHNYMENMEAMFRKVNAKEKMVGWYHSGPKLRGADLKINELIRRYCNNPVLVVVDVKPTDIAIPTNAYFAIEDISEDGKAAAKTFAHVPSTIGAEEAEEIGVEHLLRDIKDNAVGSLTTRLHNQVRSLHGLYQKLQEVEGYLTKVITNQLPVNHTIINNLQSLFAKLPNLNQVATLTALCRKTNDQYLILYVSAFIRCTIALHNLIDNKVLNLDSEPKDTTQGKVKEATELVDAKGPQLAEPPKE